jgi:hypothetical protein
MQTCLRDWPTANMAMSQVVLLGNSAIFDGTGSWIDYLSHSEMCAEVNAGQKRKWESA